MTGDPGRAEAGIGAMLQASIPLLRELPDPVTFATHPAFLGPAATPLYPRQRTILRVIYGDVEGMTAYDKEVIEGWRTAFHLSPHRWGVPYDIWDRIQWLKDHGRRHFSQVIFIGGRRAGKGLIGALLIAYEWLYLLYLDDPQAAYGLAPGKHLRTQVAATNYEQARDNLFADLFSLVIEAPCFESHLVTATRRNITLATPADLRRLDRKDHIDDAMRREMASLRAQAISSSAPAARGATNTFVALDEFAFHPESQSGKPKAEEVYRALMPTLDQMRGDGLAYIPTSPWTTDTYAYTLYLHGIETDDQGQPTNPDFLVIQQPSWGPFEGWDDLTATDGHVFISAPQVLDDDLRRIQRRDPTAFAREYAAQWTGVEGGYLTPDVVTGIFDPFCGLCGARTEASGCNRCEQSARVLTRTPVGAYLVPYRGHGDAGEAQSNFALAFGHVEVFDEPDGQAVAHVIIDYLHVWRPEDFPDHQINYTDIEPQIVDLIAAFPTLNVFSVDQYGAVAIVARLRKELRRIRHKGHVRKANFTASSNFIRAERFKIAAGEGRVHAYRDGLGSGGSSLLEAEFRGLRMKGHRLEKPTAGPCRSKDLADCVMEVVSELLADALDRLPRRSLLSSGRVESGPGYQAGVALGTTSDARRMLERYGDLARMKRGRLGGMRGIPPDPTSRRKLP